MPEDQGVAHPGPPRCHCNVESVQTIEVIHIKLVRGLGTPDDKCRWVQQWWTKGGHLIAENDPFSCDFDARITKRVDT